MLTWIDCYDDVATAIKNTRAMFSELLPPLKDARTHLRTTLAFRIKGDDGEIIESDEWPAALGPMRAALHAMLEHVEESVAIAQAQLAAPPAAGTPVDARIAMLEDQARALQNQLGCRE